MHKNRLFPPIEPYRTYRLPVPDGHELYVEEVGNPQGHPILFLHGGPGAGSAPIHRRFFDPNHFRAILLDQRGAGRSRPAGSVEHNTTWDLVADLERLRTHLGIEQWLLFGGSWGSTLGITYAIKHPTRVQGLILRGIFLMGAQELDWLYRYGASEVFPEAWARFIAPIPPAERHDLLQAYHHRLHEKTIQPTLNYAQTWTRWELSCARLLPSPAGHHIGIDAHFAHNLARIETHYSYHGGFFPEEEWLLNRIERIAHLPCIIVQGRYDMVCPMRSAWELKERWPRATLKVSPTAGHASTEEGITTSLLQALSAYVSTKPRHP